MFEIENTLSFNTDKLVSGHEFDYVTRTSQNQGVLKKTGFVNSKNINSSANWSLGLLQMDFFYRKKPWYAGQFVRKVVPKIRIEPLTAPFFTSALSKLKPLLMSVLVRHVDKIFLNSEISLPIDEHGNINFDFMVKFISELETDHIGKIEAHLLATGLKKNELTTEEQNALDKYDSIEWEEFIMGDLYEKIRTKKLSFKADELPKYKTGNYVLPCLTSSFNNQGLNYYAPKDEATILRNVISIPSNSDVYRAYFQPNDFTVLSDAYTLRWIYNDIQMSPKQYLFTVQCINKVTDLPIYSYKNKLGGWNVVKNKHIKLPVKNGEPDYEIMETLISALQKQTIKNVVLYVENKLTAGSTS